MVKNNKQLKIGIVLDDGLDNPDGVQQYILSVGSWLQRQNHKVHYIVGETTRHDIANVHSMSRNMVWSFNGNKGTMPLPANKKQIKTLLADEAFDVLHVQVPYSPFMAQRLILSAGSSTAVVGTYHIAPNSKLVTQATKILGIWLRPSLRRFDKMLSVSPAAAHFAKQTFGMDTVISPNVIDYPRFHLAKPLPQYDDNVTTILFLGRLVPRKGCQLLLEAIAMLAKTENIPPFRVLICGRGTLESSLCQYVSSMNLETYVKFVGFVSETEKPRYYASADISVFPSTGGESFGIVLLEAMASGRSVVLAGDNPGYRSVMDGQPTLLFDPNDAQQLASLLAYFVRNAKPRQTMQDWGAAYTKHFDVAIVGHSLVDIYRSALHNRNNL